MCVCRHIDRSLKIEIDRLYLAAVFDALERLRIGRGGRGAIYINICIYTVSK